MTKKELIDHLQHLEKYTHYSEDAPALREAIEMLRCSEIPNSSDERTDKRTGTHACDLIKRQDAIDAVNSIDNLDAKARGGICFKLMGLPPAQPEVRTQMSSADCISRQAAIDKITEYGSGDVTYMSVGELKRRIEQLPSAEPDHHIAEVGKKVDSDLIRRQAAIDALHMHLMYRMGTDSNKKRLDEWINNLPSAQPERTCVNCGRTVNNGGWYADGRTRCPIEEHYALPKDGYCHLWEKRNVTDDDYPERREE